MTFFSFRCVVLSAWLACLLNATQSAGQAQLCTCIAAWQDHGLPPAGCPLKDSSGRYDRSAKSYILYAGTETGAQSKTEEVLMTIRSCAMLAHAFQEHTDYDQVQMSNVYSFLPVTAAKTAGGNGPGMLLKMELSLKSGASSSAVLLKITDAAPIPGGEAGFAAATGQLLKEWGEAVAHKSPFSAPGKGWAALYPAARYTGADAAAGRYGSGTIYRYEWLAEDGAAEGLQQSIIQALRKIPAISATGSWYTEIIPGRSSITGCRLLPPNPPVTIETSFESTEQAGIVRFSIIAADGKSTAR